MFYKKKGWPEESDLILCTVKKILPHSVFVDLDEYENLEGMLHISEVAPGRIRNLREYVVEGKKLVCKVLKVDSSQRHIDVSLRRVSIALMRKKNEEFKQEQKAEKLLEFLAKKNKVEIKEIYFKIGNALVEEFGSLYYAFEDIVRNNNSLVRLKVDERLRKELVEIVREKISLPEFKVKGFLKLSSSAPTGLRDIKEVINKGIEFASRNKYKVSFAYISAPKYAVEVISNDYKTAEKALKEVSEFIIKDLISKGGVGEFQK
ncbi:MAG: translation initiation factor IF-2 subunit alpha [Candidatus Nanoarchaeia archaeon]|nr:translation initiation factor IF-2 subunit alpha [Candidatus Nanoarchaeia archaeon]